MQKPAPARLPYLWFDAPPAEHKERARAEWAIAADAKARWEKATSARVIRKWAIVHNEAIATAYLHDKIADTGNAFAWPQRKGDAAWVKKNPNPKRLSWPGLNLGPDDIRHARHDAE